MRKHAFHTLILCFVLAFVACDGATQGGIPYDGELYLPEYASGFAIYRCGEHSSVIEVRNPWQGAEKVSTEVFLSRDGESAPAGFRGEVVTLPIESVVCLSSSHIAFIDTLGMSSAVKGVSGARYISNETILERYNDGVISDIGYDTNLNYEVLASLNPDIAFIYGVGGENTAVTNKLGDMNIPAMYIADYLEENPLGKSEWVVVFGELFDRRVEAEEVFAGIAANYEALKESAACLESRPVVMLNAPYRDIWFVPGDRSYMVRLITDAGGAYACAGVDNAVSRPISGEAAWMAAQGADVWVNPNQAITLQDVKSQNPKFSNIPSVDKGRVYNCTKRRTDAGGSDFWESGALRADRALEDLIICLHPEYEGETYYFEKLN